MLKFFIILISVNLMFISKTFGGVHSNLLKFNAWLNVNGHEQYLDKTSGPVDVFLDRSLCSPKDRWNCVDADGNLIPTKDRKSIKIILILELYFSMFIII